MFDQRRKPAFFQARTLKDKQASNGRTLALNGKAWRVLRKSVMAGEPCCRQSEARGLTVLATDLDHWDNDSTNNDPLNLVPLCHECHSRKTARDMGHAVSMGCDVSGMPLDPGHPWNKAPRAVLVRPDGPWGEKSPAAASPEPFGIPSFNANCKDTL